jgi:hypothetical protein
MKIEGQLCKFHKAKDIGKALWCIFSKIKLFFYKKVKVVSCVRMVDVFLSRKNITNYSISCKKKNFIVR